MTGKWLIIIWLLLFSPAHAERDNGAGRAEQSSPEQIVPVLKIQGAIGPAVGDYLVEQIQKANRSSNVTFLIISLDTPGGLVSSLRDINQSILDSAKPVACLVYPQGARAASAGTYILYACHLAAMAPATTLGAATPVNLGPQPGGNDQDKQQDNNASAMEKKVLNDAVAYIRSLAQLRGRNAEWAELAVTEAATLTAKEALEKNVINALADSPEDLLGKIKENPAILTGLELTAESKSQLQLSQLQAVEPDWRHQFIAAITDPNVAYILLLIGIYGLILEFYCPGIGVAGITGAISLLLAMYALQMLPLSYSGFGLLIIGIGLLVAEAMVPSFGVFGVGGLIAFVLGSIFLIDTEQVEFQVSLPIIAAVAFVSVLFLVFCLSFLWRKRNAPVVSGQEEMIGAEVAVIDDFDDEGLVLFSGEQWHAKTNTPVKKGQYVEILAIKGLTLTVSPVEKEG
ncbi:NfeD family protein [Thalassotalea mangrovi]|uniref:Nodulation protein NfeD n=1 Tax=Thalassotalea mangrovi TaxID=2572245 RepID=A0A4U1B3K5_9GAMM|nr:nodulation protein NfeD [Thalassotalea mangrovi]TKB44423.1 nodulation protein NfeD [Thalassotalea mangrovi]